MASQQIERASFFSLEDQFTFYKSYHSNKINKAIHLLFVWPILWTFLALMAQFPLGKPPPKFLDRVPLEDEAWNVHAGTPLVVAYVVFYVAMDPFAGTLGAMSAVACYLTSNMWVADGGSIALAGGVHAAGWIAQFYGHAAHEGRSPALLDNFFQAIIAAPLFVLCEVLFEFGYRPAMHKRIVAKARANIADFHLSKLRQSSAKME